MSFPIGMPCCDDFACHMAPCKHHARKQERVGQWVDCDEQMVVWSDQHGFGLPVRDGGRAMIEITHCPWCGKKLPKR